MNEPWKQAWYGEQLDRLEELLNWAERKGRRRRLTHTLERWADLLGLEDLHDAQRLLEELSVVYRVRIEVLPLGEPYPVKGGGERYLLYRYCVEGRS